MSQLKFLWRYFNQKVTRKAFFSLPLWAIVISLFSLYTSYYSNDLSLNANSISLESNILARNAIKKADQANKIAEKANIIALGESKTQEQILAIAHEDSNRSRLNLSENFANETFKELESVRGLLDDVRVNNSVKDKNKLGYIVDRFEYLGDNFCRQIIDKETIRVKFYFDLNGICNNTQITSFYGNHKNGTALLCYEFFPESIFAKTLKKNSINQCKALTHK